MFKATEMQMRVSRLLMAAVALTTSGQTLFFVMCQYCQTSVMGHVCGYLIPSSKSIRYYSVVFTSDGGW